MDHLKVAELIGRAMIEARCCEGGGAEAAKIKRKYTKLVMACVRPVSDGDLCELVVAGREVAYEGATPDAIRALDKALERFADTVEWDEAPTDNHP